MDPCKSRISGSQSEINKITMCGCDYQEVPCNGNNAHAKAEVHEHNDAYQVLHALLFSFFFECGVSHRTLLFSFVVESGVSHRTLLFCFVFECGVSYRHFFIFLLLLLETTGSRTRREIVFALGPMANSGNFAPLCFNMYLIICI